MSIETLHEQDLENLTSMENRLIRLRKRECANTNSAVADFNEAIMAIHALRIRLQARFGKPVDPPMTVDKMDDYSELLRRFGVMG